MSTTGPVFDAIARARSERAPLFFVLVDPDRTHGDALSAFIADASNAGADGFLVGGSLLLHARFEDSLRRARAATDRPVIIFPGGVHQISSDADAILFLSIVSGRNPEYLIGQHVIAAPLVRRAGLEAISTAYMFVSSDRVSTAEYVSGSKPIPRHKPEIAAAHAMAAELLGMRLVYLEAGSGASQTVPEEMIEMTARAVGIPVAVGGGIATPAAAAAKARAGATVVVVGNHFEGPHPADRLRAFADAVHGAHRDTVISV